MSTSKKPGTDLAALKARLAKKTKGKEEPAAAAAPPAAAQHYAPDSESLPPPGQPPPRVEHYAEPQQHLPPPGVAAHQHVAAQPAAPSMGASHAAPAVAPPTDDPFGGGAGAFDPSEGMLDVGGAEVQSKSGFGLMIFAGLLGAAFGVAAGFLGHKMVENRERFNKGHEKGEEMVKAVNDVISARIDVSNAMDGLKQKMATDPKGAAADIEALLADKWESQVNVSQLFGWQLAAVHPNGVKRTFELFEEASRVKKDLQYLQAFLATQHDSLLMGQGPSQFAVMFTEGKADLVAALRPMCAGEGEGAAPVPCGDGDFSKAVAYEVVDAFAEGTKPKVVPRGTGEGQATLVTADGEVYAYAVGANPARNAVILREGLVQRVEDHLEAMVKIEKIAAKALEKYAEDPTVDGSVEQPDPEAGGEGQ